MEDNKTQNPVAEEPKVEEPKVEEPKAPEEPKVEEPKAPEEPKAEEPLAKDPADIANIEAEKTKEQPKVDLHRKVILKTVLGKDVSPEDYFYKGVIPAGFEGTCGKPVDREDLIALFHKVFKPEDDILFYRQLDKEVYLVIIPLKYSTEVGEAQDSLDGDFQKHAISFLNEGMVNLDTMRKKLEKVQNFVKYSDR